MKRFLNWVPPHFTVVPIAGFNSDYLYIDPVLEKDFVLTIDKNTKGYWTTDFMSFVAFEDPEEAAYFSLIK